LAKRAHDDNIIAVVMGRLEAAEELSDLLAVAGQRLQLLGALDVDSVLRTIAGAQSAICLCAERLLAISRSAFRAAADRAVAQGVNRNSFRLNHGVCSRPSTHPDDATELAASIRTRLMDPFVELVKSSLLSQELSAPLFNLMWNATIAAMLDALQATIGAIDTDGLEALIALLSCVSVEYFVVTKRLLVLSDATLVSERSVWKRVRRTAAFLRNDSSSDDQLSAEDRVAWTKLLLRRSTLSNFWHRYRNKRRGVVFVDHDFTSACL
jgi:hypothetical protein